MRRSFGLIALAMLVASFVPVAAPAAISIRCAVASPNDTPASCSYRSPSGEQPVITVATLQSYTIQWVEDGKNVSYTCTTSDCRIEPGRTVDADEGTTVRISVTQGIIIVREVSL